MVSPGRKGLATVQAGPGALGCRGGGSSTPPSLPHRPRWLSAAVSEPGWPWGGLSPAAQLMRSALLGALLSWRRQRRSGAPAPGREQAPRPDAVCSVCNRSSFPVGSASVPPTPVPGTCSHLPQPWVPPLRLTWWGRRARGTTCSPPPRLSPPGRPLLLFLSAGLGPWTPSSRKLSGPSSAPPGPSSGASRATHGSASHCQWPHEYEGLVGQRHIRVPTVLRQHAPSTP